MRYNEFRDRFQEALGASGLLAPHLDQAIESIDLATTERRWKVYLHRHVAQRAEPFHLSAKVGFRWDPFESARSYTCEEDLLRELHGSRARSKRTEPRSVRIDIAMRASLPYGAKAPLPTTEVVGPWVEGVEEKLERYLPTEATAKSGRRQAILGGREPVRIETACATDGALSLVALSVAVFWFCTVPRVWDQPQRKAREKGIDKELHDVARRLKNGFSAWCTSVTELTAWIRYFPPPDKGAPGGPGRRGGTALVN